MYNNFFWICNVYYVDKYIYKFFNDIFFVYFVVKY